MRIVKWITSIIVTVIVITVLSVYFYLKSTLPDYDGRQTVKALDAEVEIIRDAFGMPHIFANSDKDAFFALGFCQAQDRLFQMDMARRAGQGCLSEVLGTSMVKVDKLFRTLGSILPTDRWYAQIAPETREALDAFSAGVNFFIENSTSPLPMEFKLLGYKPDPWTPRATLAIMLYMGWVQNYAFKTELLHAAIMEKIGEKLAAELFLDYPTGFPAIIPEGENPTAPIALEYLETMHLAATVLGDHINGASNAWAVAAAKTKTGNALFANDPHIGLSLPSLWYESHLTTPSMNVSGVLVPGVPFIIAGANTHVAWGVTNSHHDDVDFYIEKINPGHPDQYQNQGKWEKMRILRETIPVKGSDEIDFEIKITRHCPVIDELSRYPQKKDFILAMRWTQADFPEVLEGYWMVNRAVNIADIEKAAGYAKSGQNWAYADNSGNIGFYFLGGIPRRNGFTGELPVPGWNEKYDWQGYVPDREQPHLKNPRQGFIINANNKVEPEGYPYIITRYYATPDRFVRIQEMLEQKERLGPEDFEKMQADVLMVMARDWMPVITAALDTAALSNIEQAALKEMKSWDYNAQHDRVAPTIFNVFMNYTAENTFKKRLGPDLYEYYVTGDKNIPFNVLREMIQNGASGWFDDPDTEVKEGMNHVLVQSFKDTVAFLHQKLGKDIQTWQWGQLHTLTLYHPIGKKSALLGKFLNRGPFPADGSIFTVNPTYFKISQSYEVKGGGASFRCIIDFADMDNSKMILPGGVSGNFMSPHYDDQIELWRSGKFRPFVLDRKTVLKNARYRMMMVPGT